MRGKLGPEHRRVALGILAVGVSTAAVLAIGIAGAHWMDAQPGNCPHEVEQARAEGYHDGHATEGSALWCFDWGSRNTTADAL